MPAAYTLRERLEYGEDYAISIVANRAAADRVAYQALRQLLNEARQAGIAFEVAWERRREVIRVQPQSTRTALHRTLRETEPAWRDAYEGRNGGYAQRLGAAMNFD